MLTKKMVLLMVEGLPNQFPDEELIDRIILLQRIQQGEREIKEGKGSTTEEVKQRLRKWLQ